MPTYEAICPKCGAYHEYVRQVSQYLDTPQCCGQQTEKRLFSAPMMRADIAPWDTYESPATGKRITSYTERREDMKASGCRDWEGRASEDANAKKQQAYNDESMDKKLDHTVRTLWANLPAEKKAQVLA